MSQIQSRLDELLSTMPRALEPPSELWTQIAARARRQTRSARFMNLAAGLAVASLVLLMARTAIRDGTQAPMDSIGISSRMTTVSFALPDAARYQNARAGMEATFYERLKLLRPETRATIEANLQIIRKANEDIRHALDNDPASPLLLQLLNDTYQQEFDLYKNVSRNTEPTQGRS
jgi:hypothetical protein